MLVAKRNKHIINDACINAQAIIYVDHMSYNKSLKDALH